MKKLLSVCAGLALVIGLHAQNQKNQQQKQGQKQPQSEQKNQSTGGSVIVNPKEDASNTFIGRYYQIKDSYKNLPDAWSSYASSNYSIDDFIKRYYSFKDAYPNLPPQLASKYAGSKYMQSEFEDRYYEIKKVYPDLADVHADYAASNQNRQDFITRY